MSDSSLATTSSVSLLTRGKEGGKPSSYAAVAKKVPSSVSTSERKKLDLFSSDAHPPPLRKKKPHSLILVQQKKKEPEAATAAALTKRKEPSRAVKSYSLDRSAYKILGDQPKKKRMKTIMNVLGMDALGLNFSQASLDDPNVLSCPSDTPSFMKETIKTAKVVIKKQDLRIKELEGQNHTKKDKYVPPPKDKEKLSKRGGSSATVKWKNKNIFLCSNLQNKNASEMRESARVLVNE
jgi:hypothetical protein